MTPVEYYTKNKKVYHYEPTASELEEIQARKLKAMYARRYAEKEAAEQDKLDHSKGYCPTCFMLRPLTGVCPNCQ